MSIRLEKGTVKVWLSVSAIAAIVVLIGIAESIAVLKGVVPEASVKLNLTVALYPHNSTYVYDVDINLGRGVYLVNVKPNLPLVLCVATANYSRLITLNESAPAVRLRIPCRYGFMHIHITAIVPPWHTNAGLLEVRRVWR